MASSTSYNGINRFLTQVNSNYPGWFGPTGITNSNPYSDSGFIFPESLDAPTSFKDRYDTTRGLAESNFFNFLPLDMPGASNEDVSSNSPRKFSEFYGVDFGSTGMPTEGKIAIKGDAL
tara:strand:+ start:41713 stop:42069 length:357 start_codon:yes stop_codon:yes gene_type:complete